VHAPVNVVLVKKLLLLFCGKPVMSVAVEGVKFLIGGEWWNIVGEFALLLS